MTSPEIGGLADTAPLRGLGDFPRTQVLLGEFITDRKLIPGGSRDITHLEALPAALQSSIRRAERDGGVWCAWDTEGESFAIIGYLDEVGSRIHAKPVLTVYLYDGKGRVIASSKWLEARPNKWTGCDS
jgi:hypothetical protein